MEREDCPQQPELGASNKRHTPPRLEEHGPIARLTADKGSPPDFDSPTN